MPKRAPTPLLTLRRWFVSPDLVALRHEVPLDRKRRAPLLTFYIPRLITPESPIVFLVNGFAANHKTFTFQPVRTTGKAGISMAEYLAMQGFVVVVKDSEKTRLKYESSFKDHAEMAGVYAEKIVQNIPRLVQGGLSRELLNDGLHWVGHSMGGMELMACPDRRFIKSVTTVGSPTYMQLDDKLVNFAAGLLGAAPIPEAILRRIPVPNSLVRTLVDQWMRNQGISAATRFNHDQILKFGLFMHLPIVQTITHHFLNLDHIDTETSMSFIRSGLADEPLQILKEFASALGKGDKAPGEVLGLPIVPFESPALVITGEGDTIAPTQSCLNMLNYCKHPLTEQMVYTSYDHLGLLVKFGALFDVWPVVATFIREAHISTGHLPSDETRQSFIQAIAQDAADSRLGPKARTFARRSLKRLQENDAPKVASGASSRRKASIKQTG